MAGRPGTEYLIELLRGCASSLGREMAPLEERHLDVRLDERDAMLVQRGIEAGLLRIEGNYLWTADPHQATAWLVEGDPARPCWEYVPHAATYVELVDVLGYPVGSVRFETPESEAGMSLDLAVVDWDGRVSMLGEVKRESKQIARLAALLPSFDSGVGRPLPGRAGGPHGVQREAQKLAHQLWDTRAPWLLLAAAGDRQVYRVQYDGDTLMLKPAHGFPTPDELSSALARDWPAIRRPEEWGRRDTCPVCGSNDVIHLVVGMPLSGEMERAPTWVHFQGCVVNSEEDRSCSACGHEWHAEGV